MTDIIKKQDHLMIPFYPMDEPLPDLDDMEVLPIDLTLNYWTPLAPGEVKKLWFKDVVTEEKKDEETAELYEAEVAYFLEQMEDGSHRQIINQSVRLVTTVKSINPGTPLRITYMGKKRTTTGHQMDDWQVSPLVSRSSAYKKTHPSDFDGEPDLEGVETF